MIPDVAQNKESSDSLVMKALFPKRPLLIGIAAVSLALESGYGAIVHFMPAQPVIISGGFGTPIDFDMNGDGVFDAAFQRVSINFVVTPALGTRVVRRNESVAALDPGDFIGASIDPPFNWFDGQRGLYACAGVNGNTVCLGEYADGDGILGIEFLIAGQVHYGWMSIETFPPFSGGQVHEWAYESEPGVRILAGAIPELEVEVFLAFSALFAFASRRRRRQ